MAKRSVSTEIEIAALSAAIELVGRPEFCREWLKEEFADREVKAVRVTSDIVEAVEEKMLERMTRLAKILEAELAELKNRDEDEDTDENVSEKLDREFTATEFANLAHELPLPKTSQILAFGSTRPVGIVQNVISELAQSMSEDDSKGTSEATMAEFNSWFENCIAVVIREELAKGNKISVAEAHKILSKRMTV